MAMKGCLSITKYFLFVFNLFFFILGGLLLCFGLWILFDRSSFAAMIGSSTPTLKVWSYVFSGVGILTMLLGFLGCLGSLKEVKCLLGFYFAFLLLLFATQITVGVLAYTQRNTLKNTMGEFVKDIIKNYGIHTNQTDMEENWDFTQEQIGCCGWYAPEDWLKNQMIYENSSVKLYPCSCRNLSAFFHYTNINDTDNITESFEAHGGFCTAKDGEKWPVYQIGCMNSIQSFIINNIICIVGVCIGIALLEKFCHVLLNLFIRCGTTKPNILWFYGSGRSMGYIWWLYSFWTYNVLTLFVMTLSMCLCRNLDQNYNKLARYS